MPRRPRPASRRRPPNGTALSAPQDKAVTKQSPNSKSNSGKSAHRHRIFEEEGQSGSHSDFQDEEDVRKYDASSSGFDEEQGLEQDLDDVDADAARVAQWVDDEELDGASEGDSDSDDASAAEGPSHLVRTLAILFTRRGNFLSVRLDSGSRITAIRGVAESPASSNAS